MKVIDISWPISTATTGYKDKNIVEFNQIKNFDKDGVRETSIVLSSHTGTHVDAPSHFLKDGKTIDEIELGRLVGPCKVFDFGEVVDGITYDDLKDKFGNDTALEGEIILLKTVNSDTHAEDKFTPHFTYLAESGAEFLAEKKVKAVGIDYLGIERSQPDHPTHKTLMKADISIIEGLRLEAVDEGQYLFVCLPLNTIGLEAAPARACLIKQ